MNDPPDSATLSKIKPFDFPLHTGRQMIMPQPDSGDNMVKLFFRYHQ